MNHSKQFGNAALLAVFGTFALAAALRAQTPGDRINVLMVAIDDINDWIAPLGGHPQAQTPNMDRFCEGGAVVFRNAVCPAPICGPSRSAILSGFMPHRTGVYGNASNMIYTDLVKAHATLPEYFSKHGYHTLSNGKVFHKHATGECVDFGHWAFDEHARARRGVKDNADKNSYTSSKAGIINGKASPDFKAKDCKLSWGPTTKPFEKTVDYLVADWAREALDRDFEKPFFMAVGIIKPHLPWFVPKEFFGQYDLDAIKTPEVLESDLDDILLPNGKPAYKPTGEYRWIKKHGLEKEATRAYLASVSYADACLGIVLDALGKSRYADNTIVVIWGDHGWHLGEKQRYLKNTLWAESAKTPFMVRLPGMKDLQYCDRNVNLIDIYPTLVGLCGLPEKELDGHDFSALLGNPTATWEFPGVTVSNGGTSVMGERWHYIRSLSGVEELYNLTQDPMEWTNLIRAPEHAEVVAEMKKWVPETRVKFDGPHFKKPPNYVDADSDPTIKPTRDLSKLR